MNGLRPAVVHSIERPDMREGQPSINMLTETSVRVDLVQTNFILTVPEANDADATVMVFVPPPIYTPSRGQASAHRQIETSFPKFRQTATIPTHTAREQSRGSNFTNKSIEMTLLDPLRYSEAENPQRWVLSGAGYQHPL